MADPLHTSNEPSQSVQRPQKHRPSSPAPSCVSMKSEKSMDQPVKFSNEPTPSDQKEESEDLTVIQHKDNMTDTMCKTETPVLSSTSRHYEFLRRVKKNHKAGLKRRFENISEGIVKPGVETLLNEIYTELYITEGESEEVNKEHEIWQVESACRTETSEDTPINYNDIFKPLPRQDKHIRTVMTKGVAGIGKTVSVQKFILDWIDGVANLNVDFMLPLPFRELNLVKNNQYSLHKLLLDFYPELKELNDDEYKDCQVVFIFDGLDESRLTLNFEQTTKSSDIKEILSVNVLITRLIQGSLFPSALIWITSRPAAVSQIPAQYVNQVTEVRGFNDPQREEYFRKRISNESQANRIISHIKESRSLYVMCHIPVFCWIAATVLQQILEQDNCKDIPKSLTQMFIHFLLIQTTRKDQKYKEGNEADMKKVLKSQKEIILKLSELAFKNLENGNLMFYQEDLRECEIDLSEASVYSGMCTEIFQVASVFHNRKVYSFVHLSIQEFMAALHIFSSFESGRFEALRTFIKKENKSLLSLHVLLKSAIDKSLESSNGHLDLFVRFLMGISLENNQRLLQGLLNQMHNNSENINKACRHIKGMRRKHLSPERCINLLFCLFEMNDHSMHEEIQQYLKSPVDFKHQLSPVHCSALAHMLLMSEKVLDKFDLKKYNTTNEGRRRLIPAVRNCRKALLADCGLGKKSCAIVASVLRSSGCMLTVLDFSHNDLQEAEETLLSGLRNRHCKLNKLKLVGCKLSDKSCGILASVLQSSNSLIKLDLSDNDLGDFGVQLLSEGLSNPHCKLQILRLSACLISEKGCGFLASALTSNPSHLKELDLSYNHPAESGRKLLFARLEDCHCKLEKLNTDYCAEVRTRPGVRKYACELTLDPNTAHRNLSLSQANRRAMYVSELQPYPDHPERFDVCYQVLCGEALSGCCYWEAEWSGDEAHIGVAYRSIKRKGRNDDCKLGGSDKSWNLICSGPSYSAKHENKITAITAPSSSSRRVGVYLNWLAGILSFYSISSDTLTHLYTYHCTFTEPLYAGFKVKYSDSSVSLCEITGW